MQSLGENLPALEQGREDLGFTIKQEVQSAAEIVVCFVILK
jgi:hypothetical protein